LAGCVVQPATMPNMTSWHNLAVNIKDLRSLF